MSVEEEVGFDCGRFTPDTGAIANLLWGDSDLAIVLLDPQRRLLAHNVAAESFLTDEGLRPGGDFTAMSRRVWLDGEEEECPPSRWPSARALAGETVHRQVLRLGTESSEEPVHVCLSALPVALRDGSCGVVLAWQDIGDRRLHERRDRREIRRLEQLLEGATDFAIVMLDATGRVTSWSRSAEHLYGHPPQEAIGLPFKMLFNDGDDVAATPESILGEAAETGTARTRTLRVRADRTAFWVEGTLTALREDGGDVRGYVEVTHDISDRQLAELEVISLNERLRGLNRDLEDRVFERTGQLARQTADLAAANAELESFSSIVSHDLRAPLRAVGGYSRMLEEQFGDRLPPEGIEYLHKLNRSASMMGRLIDGLLSLSRTQRASLSFEPLDMAGMVRDCWEVLAPERAGREVELAVAELPPSEGDRQLVSQVWFHLLQNALKYTATRPRALVEISAAVVDGVVHYRVQDNGVGFDDRYAARIGQVFQRLHDSTEFPGTGVGLATVQRIALRHGGDMSAHGEPGAGAVFEFSLGT